MKRISLFALLMVGLAISACSSVPEEKAAEPSTSLQTQLAQRPISNQHIENVTERMYEQSMLREQTATIPMPVEQQATNSAMTINEIRQVINQVPTTLPSTTIPNIQITNPGVLQNSIPPSR